MLLFVAPRSQWTMLDDWGDTLGLKGSGSHSVRLEHACVPAEFALEDTWMVDADVSNGTPGYRLHGNPMYAGRTLSVFQSELTAVMVGAGQGRARGVRGDAADAQDAAAADRRRATRTPTTSAGSVARSGSSRRRRRC